MIRSGFSSRNKEKSLKGLKQGVIGCDLNFFFSFFLAARRHMEFLCQGSGLSHSFELCDSCSA